MDSIINQTYNNLEIILVDDASPDGCPQICDEYAKNDKRIVVIHKENGGLSSARNAGLDVAKGEYISFIDSDDYISNIFIETLFNMCQDYDADISQCSLLRFYENISENIDDNFTVNTYNSIDIQKKLYVISGKSNYVVVCNKLYKASVYKDLRFPIGKINEDEFTTYKAYNLINKVAVTDMPLYYYRQNPNSIMNKKFNINRYDAIEAYEQRLDYYLSKEYYDLYEMTVFQFQELLKQMYYETYISSLNDKNIYLKMICNKLKKNYSIYKKLSSISLINKIKNKIICVFPVSYVIHSKLSSNHNERSI